MRIPEEVIMAALYQSLNHAQDNISRAKMQLERMPFDHDTRNALRRYEEWEAETLAALVWIQRFATNDGPEVEIIRRERQIETAEDGPEVDILKAVGFGFGEPDAEYVLSAINRSRKERQKNV